MQTSPSLRAYQEAGVEELLKKLHTMHGALLADEMGLGKTCVSIEVANRLNPRSVLIICPASLCCNWKHELDVWSRLHVDVEVISYGKVVNGHQKSSEYGLVIFDESHFLKSPTAKRTKASLALKADYRLFLTGTPIPNKPIEAFNVLKALGLKMSYQDYGFRYCGGRVISVPRRGGGKRKAYDFSGASNLDELNAVLRKAVMVRRTKAETLTELPPKIRQVVAMKFDSGESAAFRRRFASLGEAADILDEVSRVPFTEIAEERHNVALHKLPFVLRFIDDLLESGVEKLAVFAHHRDIVEAIVGAGPDRVFLYGGMSAKEKDAVVQAFQHGPAKVFVGNILAAGVGLTLTAASVCVMAEETWTPGDLIQAEDRLHRFGQKDVVQIYHIVADGSLDARIVKALIHKQTIIEEVMK